MTDNFSYKQSPKRLQDDPLRDYPENLIINRPDLKTRALLIGEGILTTLFWGFWAYLWLPIISLIAWLFGFQILYIHMVELGGFDGLLHQMGTFSSGIGIFSGTLAVWSFYNLKRYGSYNRRNKTLRTNTKQMAEEFSVTYEIIDDIRKSKTVRFHFNDVHEIAAIDTDSGKTTILQKTRVTE